MRNYIILHEATTGEEIHICKKIMFDTDLLKRPDGFTDIRFSGILSGEWFSACLVKETPEEIIKMLKE